MKKKTVFDIGDKIIDCGRVYSVFKIKKRKNLNGEKEEFVYYKPLFKKKKDKELVCSIPIKNLCKAKIRKPVAKEELEEILDELSKIPKIKSSVKTTKLREKLRTNDVRKTAEVLKILWAVKNDQSISFTRWKRSVFNLAMKNLTEETAFVTGISVREAKQKIRAILSEENDKE